MLQINGIEVASLDVRPGDGLVVRLAEIIEEDQGAIDLGAALDAALRGYPHLLEYADIEEAE